MANPLNATNMFDLVGIGQNQVLGKQGPRLKAESASKISVRNNIDNVYVDFQAANMYGVNLTLTGTITAAGGISEIASTTLRVDDKNIEIGYSASPTDATANGGGMLLYGTTNKTFQWQSGTGSWLSSENIELAASKVFRINGNQVLSQTTLGSTVIYSSLTTVGTITTGTWNGTIVSVPYGGTGASTITTNGVVYGNGTSPVGVTAAGSQYQVLQPNASGVPVWGALNLGQAAAVTGTLPVGSGGTGSTTFTQYGVLVGNGTSGIAAVSPVAGTTKVLTSGGSSANPTWSYVSSLYDTNGVAVVNGTTVASAVNALNVIPGASGTGVALIPGGTGSDTNVNLILDGKGTGTVQLGSNMDVNGKTITTSLTNGNIALVPNGTGSVTVPAGYESNVTNSSLVNALWVKNQNYATALSVGTTGTFGSSSIVPVITVNSQGLVSNVTTATITPAAIGAVANAGGAPSLQEGAYSAIPSAGTIGRIYIATDTLGIYRDNGSTWTLVEPACTGDVTSSAGSTAMTLATVNSNVGSYGAANTVAGFTVNGKGLITGVNTYTITPLAIGAAPLNSPNLTGNPTAPTPSATDNSTAIATTAYVTNALTQSGGGNNLRRTTISSGYTQSANIDSPLPAPSGKHVYVDFITAKVATVFAGNSVANVIIKAGSNTLTDIQEIDPLTTGIYKIPVDMSTDLSGLQLTASWFQADGVTTATPTSGSITITVSYVQSAN